MYVVKYMQSHNTRIDAIGACDCYTLDIPGSNPKSRYYRTKNVFFFAPYLENSDCNYVLPAGRYLSMTYRGDLTKTRELLPLLTLFSKNCIYRYSLINSSVSYGVITILSRSFSTVSLFRYNAVSNTMSASSLLSTSTPLPMTLSAIRS